MLDPKLPEQPSIILTDVPAILPTRRKVITALGLATTAFCASSLTSEAAWSSKKEGSGNNDSALAYPEEWAKLEGRNLSDYIKYLNSLKLKNISPNTVIAAHAKKHGHIWNRLPPKNWWNRMGHTLRVVDYISAAMKVPVKEIVSAYRTPQYNASCSGAKKGSWHQANVAVDVQFHTSARNVTYAARNLRDRGLFKGGVGSYSSFTHIDTRGQNINW
jgi:hypothetical protein